ncbi:MAG: hypothetical protein V7731_08415 [Amphritea sp.]
MSLSGSILIPAKFDEYLVLACKVFSRADILGIYQSDLPMIDRQINNKASRQLAGYGD